MREILRAHLPRVIPRIIVHFHLLVLAYFIHLFLSEQHITAIISSLRSSRRWRVQLSSALTNAFIYSRSLPVTLPNGARETDFPKDSRRHRRRNMLVLNFLSNRTEEFLRNHNIGSTEMTHSHKCPSTSTDEAEESRFNENFCSLCLPLHNNESNNNNNHIIVFFYVRRRSPTGHPSYRRLPART